MKKLSLITLFCLLAIVARTTAQDMRTLFITAPDTIFPLLDVSAREDCVDFLDAGMRARVTNRLGGKSELLAITPSFLELRCSDSSTVQMRLFPCTGDTVVAVVRTVCAEACDSRISFYRKDWATAPITFERPLLSDFFVSSDSLDHCIVRCDIYLVALSLSPDDDTLVAEYTMPRYMSEEDAKLVTPHLQRLVYRWKGNAFLRE